VLVTVFYEVDVKRLYKDTSEGGVEYLHRSPAGSRGDEKGSLEYETVKMVARPRGLGPENYCAGEDQQQL
jgi:hypothetical protein